MMHYRGAGAGGGGGGISVEELRTATDRALRQVKKLRKYELEQVCNVAGLSTMGLKATLLAAVESFLGSQFSMVARSGGAGPQAQLLLEVTNQVTRGYSDVANKRPAAGHYSHHSATMKQDGGHRVSDGSVGYSRVGGGGSAAGGGGRWDEDAGLDILRRSELDPFVEVTNTLSAPVRLERRSGTQSLAVLSFSLTEQGLQAVRVSLSHGKSTVEGRKAHILLRSFKLPTGEGDPDVEGHLWPLESACQVNGVFQQLKQRKVFFQGTTRKLKGDCSPHDIGPACHLSFNRVELYSSDPEAYAVVVQMVRLVGVEEVLLNIKRRQALTKEEALRRVKRSFKACADLNAPMESESEEEMEDSDDELMATATRLSLRCPLGLVPITCPGRGRNCKHLQCFDLETFLNFNKDCAGAAWKCGVCNLPLKPTDVVVDTYLDEVVRTLGKQGLTNDAEEVEIHKDGHWDPILEDQKMGKNRRDRRKMQPPAPGPAASQPAAASNSGAVPENGGELSGSDGGLVEGGGAGDGNSSERTWSVDDDSVVGSGAGGGGGDGSSSAAAGLDPSFPGGGGGSSSTAAAGGGRTSAPPVMEIFDLSLDSDEEDNEPPASIAPAGAGAASSGSASSAAGLAAAAPPHPAASPPLPHSTGNGGSGINAGAGGGAAAGGAMSLAPPSRRHNSSPALSMDSAGESGGHTSPSGGRSSSVVPGIGGGGAGSGSDNAAVSANAAAAADAGGRSMEANGGASSLYTGDDGAGHGVLSGRKSPSFQIGGLSRSRKAAAEAGKGDGAQSIGWLGGAGGRGSSSGGGGGGTEGDGGRSGGSSLRLWDNSLVAFTSGQAHAPGVPGGGGGDRGRRKVLPRLATSGLG